MKLERKDVRFIVFFMKKLDVQGSKFARDMMVL